MGLERAVGEEETDLYDVSLVVLHRKVYQTILLKCKEKVQKKVFLKVDHLAQKPAQNGCFLQESRFMVLHKHPSFVQKLT